MKPGPKAPSPLVKALTDLGYSTKEAESTPVADLLDLGERLEAALSAWEKVSGLSPAGIAKRRLEGLFAAVGLEDGALQASITEGRVSAQWTPPNG